MSGFLNRRIAGVCGVVFAALTLGGCRSSSAPAGKPTALPTAAHVDPQAQGPGDFKVPASAAQRADLADGIVTYDEYMAALQRLRSCVQADGFDLNIHPEVNQISVAGYPDAAEPSFNRCYPQEFSLVDVAWQTYRADFGADAKAMADCLVKRGKTPGLTLNEKYGQLSALGVDAYKDCPGVTGGG